MKTPFSVCYSKIQVPNKKGNTKHQTFSISEKYKLLLKIILPILITQIAMYLISFFDILMSSKYGTADLAGVSIGTSIWLPINTGLTGILLSITPIVAQLRGAKKRYDVKKAVQQGLYVVRIIKSFCTLYSKK